MRRLIVAIIIGACSGPPVPPRPTVLIGGVWSMPDTRPPPSFRLPQYVIPTHERVELTIDPAKPRATGSIQIDALVPESKTYVRPAPNTVWLNATDLHVRDATIGREPARVIEHGDMVGLVASRPLVFGKTVITATFDASIDAERSRGMYSAIDHGEPYVYTFFEAIDARRAFPCFDEPGFKIPWTLVFHVREHDVALGNAPVVKETPERDGMKRVELAETKPLPSYLVAFVVGPFDVVDDGVFGRANTPLRFVVPKGHADELGYAKQVTPRVVAALEDFFDMDYPYGKLDVAVVPRYWGTMEHPGIVAMGQTLTLIAPNADTHEREQHYANILGHELGHYWFGDLVTMAWWDDTWLNEALGTWLDMVTTEHVMPAWHFRERRVDLAIRAMTSDETLSALPIHRPIETRDAIGASFDNDSTYYKGASIVRACEAFVSDVAWRAFIRGYVRKHANGNASDRDFIGEMRAVLGAPVADAFDMYISKPGVPLVDVRCEGDHLAITRTRSLPHGVADPSPHAWPVPVCIRFGDGKHAMRACTTGDSIALGATGACPTWIVPNDDATGYYRSIVDPAQLDPRSPAKLSGAEKRMAVADLRAMVTRGELRLDRLLALVPALVADPDPLVALAGVEATAIRADALDDATYAAWRAWRLRVLGGLARSLGWQRAKTDSDERERLREVVLRAVGEDDPRLVRDATRLADDWLVHHGKIDTGLLDAAFAVSAAHGDAARFERYVAAATRATDLTDRQRLLEQLGAFENSGLARRAYELVIGHDFDIRDSNKLLSGAVSNRPVRDVLLEFLKLHLDDVLARLRDDEQTWLLTAIAGAYCDAPHRDAAAALVQPRAARSEDARLPVARALEKAEQCEAELGREAGSLHSLFDN